MLNVHSVCERKAFPPLYPPNHKTIFLLDHTPYFGTNCDTLIEFDFSKTRGPGVIPLAPIAKTLWTCSVEAAIEYCRIVWDLFPTGKLLRFIVSDTKGHSLNSWSPTQQSLNHLLNGLSVIGTPAPQTSGETCNIFPGLQAAVQAMCECSEQQHEKRTSLNECPFPVINRNRIICITSVPDNDKIKAIEDKLQSEILMGNKVAAASDLLIPVDNCELVILNIQSNPGENIPKHKVSSILESETHNVKASCGLPNKLSSLILQHYNLASTTVTGIPMKEEQNASSSANYDVELFHLAKAHESLFKGTTNNHSLNSKFITSTSMGGLPWLDDYHQDSTTNRGQRSSTHVKCCGVDMNQISTKKEGFEYSTIKLKWCTPRGCTASEMHNCISMHRITPVDVNSRPSSCLINFLIGGRSVMLEVTRRNNSKSLSHLLAAHGGQIYMHSLCIGRSLHEDPPSISEGAGGRVTDYRITDFGAFMQQNKLVPLKISKSSQTPTVKRTRIRLERHTRFWPMTISSTSIFNFKQYLDPILSLMLQNELREPEVLQCKQCIFNLVTLESKHEPLHSVSSGQRSKGPKSSREEQYKALWQELENFLRAHCVTDKHINVLNCLLEVRNKDAPPDLGDKVELDQALRELDQMTSKGSERVSVIRATTDSPLSPDPVHPTQPLQTKTLLEMWVSKFARTKPRPEFAGLANAQVLPDGKLKAKLYPHLKERPKISGKPRIMD